MWQNIRMVPLCLSIISLSFGRDRWLSDIRELPRESHSCVSTSQCWITENLSILSLNLAVIWGADFYLSPQGRHSDWKCPVQGFSGPRRTTPSCPQLGEAWDHQSVCHWGRWQPHWGWHFPFRVEWFIEWPPESWWELFISALLVCVSECVCVCECVRACTWYARTRKGKYPLTPIGEKVNQTQIGNLCFSLFCHWL